MIVFADFLSFKLIFYNQLLISLIISADFVFIIDDWIEVPLYTTLMNDSHHKVC